jgi:hypothetical protein
MIKSDGYYLLNWFLSNKIECYLSMIKLFVATHGHHPSEWLQEEEGVAGTPSRRHRRAGTGKAVNADPTMTTTPKLHTATTPTERHWVACTAPQCKASNTGRHCASPPPTSRNWEREGGALTLPPGSRSRHVRRSCGVRPVSMQMSWTQLPRVTHHLKTFEIIMKHLTLNA